MKKQSVKWTAISLFLLIMAFLTSSSVLAENIDESALFDDASQLVETSKTTDIPVFSDQRSVGFSGRIDSFTAVQAGEEALKGHASDSSVYSLNQADLFLDIRLPNQVKAFADLSVLSASTSATDNANVLADIKELFVDFNVDKKVYVRTGKQFIRWGRGYFWNPVDFLNTNRINFLNREALRSGVTGTRIHIPGKTKNTYVFINMNEAERLDQCEFLLKEDCLIGATELGFSMWGKPHQAARFGLDWSTHKFGLDISGEYAYENQKNWQYVTTVSDSAVLKSGDDFWTSSAVLTLQKQFRWQRPNRITAVYECYYNGRGYDSDILKDPEMKALLFANNSYQANYLSTAYHAVFLSIKEFPTYATTFSINILQNLVDKSALASLGLGYTVTDGLQLNTSLLVYTGNESTEYGLSGAKTAVIFQGVLTF